MPHIVVCEIDKCGVDHIYYNASILETVLLAWPGDTVTFHSEPNHAAAVRELIEEYGTADRTRLQWQPLDLAATRSGFREKLGHERRWLQALRASTADGDCRFAFICSVTDSGLLALKLSMVTGRLACPVLAVVHSPLSTLALFQSPRAWRRFINLRTVLRLPHPPRLRLVALGHSIHAHLERYAPRSAHQFRPLGLTYFWSRHDARVEAAPLPLRFGFVGVAGRNKGFEDYCRLAESLTSDHDHVEFSLAGYVRDAEAFDGYSRFVTGIGTAPLTPDEFARRLDALTYMVWTGNPAHYELTASATFVDSLSYVKPGIYYRNAFVESYFERMGDIGYLCDSYDEMLETLRELSRLFPLERYQTQCRNILAGRVLFEPASRVSALKTIVGEIESSPDSPPS